MKIHTFTLFSKLVLIILVCVQLFSPSAVYAATTVGTGSAGSCTEAALDTALAVGGAIDFNCGGGAVTIVVTSPKIISKNTQINGGGLITLSGNNTTQIIAVQTGFSLSLSNITLTMGNSGTTQGGAMNVATGATASITNSTFSNNTSAFDSASAHVPGGGGAIYSAGALTITGSTFYGNSATGPGGDGGALISDFGFHNHFEQHFLWEWCNHYRWNGRCYSSLSGARSERTYAPHLVE